MSNSENSNLLLNYRSLISSVLALAILLIYYIYSSRKKYTKQLVGYVSALYVYPVKSCEAVQLSSAEITNLGVNHDRQFVLVNKYGTLMTLRKYPKLVLIHQNITEDGIILTAEGMPQLNLPLVMEDGDFSREINVFRKSTMALHVSKEVDDWFAEYLNVEGCQLFCFPLGGKPRYSDDNGVKIVNYSNENDTLMFADECPLLIISEATVEELNNSLKSQVNPGRFRPNIVLSKCLPHAEEDWGLIQIGDTNLQGLYPCARCVAVSVNNATAEIDGSILPTLKRVNPASKDYPVLRGAPVIGFNYGVRKPGEIHVGDAVYKLVLKS